MRILRHLANRRRTAGSNHTLGMVLAFNAGAINAGGLLAMHAYTSHMTGFASQIADGWAFDDAELLLNALGAILAFTSGAATCIILVNWARQHRLQSVYALPLLQEALLLLVFALVGSMTLTWNTHYALPVTLLMLSFIMGWQNAISSKSSGGRIRTTHMTGNITDLGMELGNAILPATPRRQTPPDWQRMRICAGLFAMFVLGGMVGAVGFEYVHFIYILPLAAMLLVMAMPPLLRDALRSKNLRRFFDR